MPRRYSSREVLKALGKLGFEPARRSRGGHQTLICELSDGTVRVVVVPLNKRQLPAGTFGSILRQANINEAEFLDALK